MINRIVGSLPFLHILSLCFFFNGIYCIDKLFPPFGALMFVDLGWSKGTLYIVCFVSTMDGTFLKQAPNKWILTIIGSTNMHCYRKGADLHSHASPGAWHGASRGLGQVTCPTTGFVSGPTRGYKTWGLGLLLYLGLEKITLVFKNYLGLWQFCYVCSVSQGTSHHLLGYFV